MAVSSCSDLTAFDGPPAAATRSLIFIQVLNLGGRCQTAEINLMNILLEMVHPSMSILPSIHVAPNPFDVLSSVVHQRRSLV